MFGLSLILLSTVSFGQTPHPNPVPDCGSLYEMLEPSEQMRRASGALIKARRWQAAAWRAREEGAAATADKIEKRLTHILKTAALSKQKEFASSGSSEVYFVELAGGLRAVFKPSPKFWRARRVKPFHDDFSAEREMAAYAFDRAVNGHMVPVTVKRTIDGMEGSLQIWVDFNPGKIAPGASRFRSSERLEILDYMMGTHDRSPANRPELDGAPVAIDQGLAFLTKAPHYSFGIKSPPSLEAISDLTKYGAALKSFGDLDVDKIRKAIEPFLKPQEVEECLERVRKVIGLREKASGT